jgi:hypothetical protein
MEHFAGLDDGAWLVILYPCDGDTFLRMARSSASMAAGTAADVPAGMDSRIEYRRQIGGNPIGLSPWTSFAIDRIFGSPNRGATI